MARGLGRRRTGEPFPNHVAQTRSGRVTWHGQDEVPRAPPLAGALSPAGGRRWFEEEPRNLAAFWLLGVLNNSTGVIMMAGAKVIHGSGVGLVFLSAVVPSLALKLSGPYWFHLLTYRARMSLVAALMAASLVTVALGQSLPAQLSGVALASLGGGIGEPNCLAMCSFYNSRETLTMWSSGTGFAGVFGYAWVAVGHYLLGLPFPTVLLSATSMAAAWLWVYLRVLRHPAELDAAGAPSPPGSPRGGAPGGAIELPIRGPGAAPERKGRDGGGGGGQGGGGPGGGGAGARGHAHGESRAQVMGAGERLARTVALWPWMVPLLVVYFSEYAMQAGAWAAIGFPASDPGAREAFYEYANWTYQAGVFVSRSSGVVLEVGMGWLWAMPVAQAGFLAFFVLTALFRFWYGWSLLAPCFATGLLGGAVYVNAFTHLARSVPPEYREFSLYTASLADTLGIMLADAAGVVIQGCLFRYNGLPGADYSCGA